MPLGSLTADQEMLSGAETLAPAAGARGDGAAGIAMAANWATLANVIRTNNSLAILGMFIFIFSGSVVSTIVFTDFLRTKDQPISWRLIGVRYFSSFQSIEAGESEPPEKWFYCFTGCGIRLAGLELNFVFVSCGVPSIQAFLLAWLQAVFLTC
jgi:hypothetical protein